jgi:class 3 adenylate cyclase
MLTLEDLSRQIGEPIERLQEWCAHGFIGRGSSGSLVPEDLLRARLIQFLVRRGIRPESIAELDREQRLLERYVEICFPRGVGRTYSLPEAAAQAGIDLAGLRRFWEAASLNEQGEWLDEADVELLRALQKARDAGFPEAAILELARVYADALGRVADAEVRLFHFHVHEALKAQGAGDQMMPLVEPVILHFHRRAWARAIQEDALLHFQEEPAEQTGEEPGTLRMAVGFVDLSRFTSLAEAMGDRMAADVLGRFSRLVREAVSRWQGQVIKQIGDAFMLTFTNPRSAVSCALEINERAEREPHFPAVRSGVHWGSVLYREGDYIGTNVNIAARLAAEAQAHQTLVTAAVHTEMAGVPGIRFVHLGKRRLKGLADDPELFEVMRDVEQRTEPRLRDPVCGMELATEDAAATLVLDGRPRLFCSQACLQRFVAAPERYAGQA